MIEESADLRAIERAALREGYRRGQEDMRERAAVEARLMDSNRIRSLPIEELPE